MHRQIVYPGSIPLETDLLNTNKYAMIGLAKLASAMMGATTYLRGLTCSPSSPASMVVNVARGEIYSVQNVDNSAYSSLPADTTNTILKQGIVMSSTAFTLTAPTTAGQSINYLVQVTFSETDSDATVLPYYNAANPSVAYSGPNNSGAAQNTVRSGVCTVALKAGVAATTGTQTTPSVDTGYTAAWVITVAQGATSVTAANISVAANAPFLPVSGIVAAIQQSTMTYATDTGAANNYVAQFVPAIPTLTDGMRFTFRAKVANTGASTFAANGGSAYPLYSHAHQALQGGEIIANGLIEVEWNSTLTAWVLCGNSGGALPVAAATQSNHALQLGQAVGRLLNVVTLTSSGSYIPSPGTKSIIVEVQGAGGGGAGAGTTSSSAIAIGSGGSAGAYAKSLITNLAAAYAVVVGLGGSGGNGSANGLNGGASSFGSLITANGGFGGGFSNGAPPALNNATGAATASGGNLINITGASPVIAMALSLGVCIAGGGGNSMLGNGGGAHGTAGGGSPASGYGAGGGGANAYQSNSIIYRGADGGNGAIFVWEFS